jgi:hypothetical protein
MVADGAVDAVVQRVEEAADRWLEVARGQRTGAATVTSRRSPTWQGSGRRAGAAASVGRARSAAIAGGLMLR